MAYNPWILTFDPKLPTGIPSGISDILSYHHTSSLKRSLHISTFLVGHKLSSFVHWVSLLYKSSCRTWWLGEVWGRVGFHINGVAWGAGQWPSDKWTTWTKPCWHFSLYWLGHDGILVVAYNPSITGWDGVFVRHLHMWNFWEAYWHIPNKTSD